MIKVECLTRTELIEDGSVRSKSMKVTVKPADAEKALEPGTWPYRVGVRYFRAPQKRRQERDSWKQQSNSSNDRMEAASRVPAPKPQYRAPRKDSNIEQLRKYMNIFELMTEEEGP